LKQDIKDHIRKSIIEGYFENVPQNEMDPLWTLIKKQIMNPEKDINSTFEKTLQTLKKKNDQFADFGVEDKENKKNVGRKKTEKNEMSKETEEKVNNIE